MSSPRFLYIIYLELCSSTGSSVMTRDLTKWPYVLNGTAIPLGQIWAYLLVCGCFLLCSDNRSKKCPLWKCSVLIKGRTVEHPFWAGLIFVNCLSVPYLSLTLLWSTKECLYFTWFSRFLPTGLLETMTNDEFVKRLCTSSVYTSLTHGSLIAIFLAQLHLWSAVQGEEQS